MSVVLYILLTVAFLSFAASIVFAYLNNRAEQFVTGLFYNNSMEIDKKYREYATPKEIVFIVMWAIIYIANAIGLLYMLIGAFIPPRMSPVKVTPSLTPPLFLFAYSLAFLMTVGWIFAYDNEILELSFAFLVLGAIFSFIAIGASCKRIQDNIFTLEIKGNVMMWMIRVLVQNPLCILATWLVVAAMLNMTELILYTDSFDDNEAQLRNLPGMDLETASMVGLGVLFALAIIWFILENFVWEKYCRFNFTIYPVLIFALAGVVTRISNFRSNINVTRLLVLAAVELAFFCLAFIVRIALFIYKVRARANANS